MLLHRSGHGSLVGSIDLPAFRGNGDADADLLLGMQIEPLAAPGMAYPMTCILFPVSLVEADSLPPKRLRRRKSR